VVVSSDETFSRKLTAKKPQQLTAVGFGNPRQLTTKGYLRLLYVCFNLVTCVNNNFPYVLVRGLKSYVFKSCRIQIYEAQIRVRVRVRYGYADFFKFRIR